VYAGNVNLGATLFSPLLTTSFQRTYGNIYAKPSDMYEDLFATGIESLLPSTTPLNSLLSTGKLPATALFAADSLPQPAGFGVFFGTPNLIKTSYRNAVLADAVTNPTTPQHPLRVAAYKNDLLAQNWTPAQPMLLCGGNADPTVFFSANTLTAKAYFSGKGVPDPAVTVLDAPRANMTLSTPPKVVLHKPKPALAIQVRCCRPITAAWFHPFATLQRVATLPSFKRRLKTAYTLTQSN